MFKFFSKNTPEKPSVKTFPLGALPSPQDTRDIPYSTLFAKTPLPASYRTDTSGFPLFDQGFLGTCVAHTFAFVKMVLDRIETGKLVVYSRRFIYAIARRGGNYNNNFDDAAYQGLYPEDGAKVLSAIGTISEANIDDNTLPHSKYVKDLVITEAMKKEANYFRSGGRARVGLTFDEIANALMNSKALPITILVDWNKIDIDGTIHAPQTVYGSHEGAAIGFEPHPTLPMRRLVWQNWWGAWGSAGKGYINEDEIGKVIVQCMAITDIPNDLIARAKDTQYIFLKTLKQGMRGDHVRELQKRYKALGIFDDESIDGVFGGDTYRATMYWQKLQGLVPDGVFGPKSRDTMNAQLAPAKTISMIDKWCLEIKRIEKAKPELNNPGNLKFFPGAKSSQKAIGKDYRGICIFPSYEVGYMALRDLLVRAATGNSSAYFPEMTLYQFYAGIAPYTKYPGYAPESDRNTPNLYAEGVAKGMGVSPNIQIKDLL